jgi:hypothetical protein
VPRIHHVNLGVPPALEAEETSFLVDLLGYRRLAPERTADERVRVGARWFEGDDGVQIHLSLDDEHRAAEKAHTAITVVDEVDGIRRRMTEAAYPFEEAVLDDTNFLICRDPAGNRWELRSWAAAKPVTIS